MEWERRPGRAGSPETTLPLTVYITDRRGPLRVWYSTARVTHPAPDERPAPPAAPVAGEDFFCPGCGYDLRGLPAGRAFRCPECGMEIDPAAMRRSLIPWVHRAEIGRWRAYWRTVWMVTRRPGAVAAEAAKPLGMGDVEGFRRVTVLLVFLPLAGLAVLNYWATMDVSIPLGNVPWLGTLSARGLDGSKLVLTRANTSGWVVEWVVVAAFLAGLWLFLLGTAGLPSYFFHPPHLPVVQQNRAVAVSYLACAPLAYSPLAAALVVVAVLVDYEPFGRSHTGFQSTALFAILGVGIGVVEGVACNRAVLVFLKRTTHCGAGRVWAATLLLPVLSAAWAVVTLVLLPAAAAFVGIVVLSFA